MKRAGKIYMAIIIMCFIVISVSIYYILGGFDQVDVFVLDGKQRTVIGKEYIEKNNYDIFKDRFTETRLAIDSGFLKGQLTVVFFEEDYFGRDSVHYLIGASVDEIKNVLRLPAGYSYKEFKTDKVFKMFITQHEWIRPLSQEINQLMEIKAIKEGFVLQPYSFELYYEDNSLSVEHWAR